MAESRIHALREVIVTGTRTLQIQGVKVGEYVDFVRWHLTRDGWEAETVHVRYVRSNKATLTGISGDRLVTVPRAEWELAIA